MENAVCCWCFEKSHQVGLRWMVWGNNSGRVEIVQTSYLRINENDLASHLFRSQSSRQQANNKSLPKIPDLNHLVHASILALQRQPDRPPSDPPLGPNLQLTDSILPERNLFIQVRTKFKRTSSQNSKEVVQSVGENHTDKRRVKT